MQINPYLNFNGDCAEAFAFYEKVFDGKITFVMTHGESPMKDVLPVEWHGAIMHATLDIGGQTLNGADAPGERYKTPAGFAVSVSLSDAERAERIFSELVKGGVEQMAMQETFWAERFGMLVDRFGIPWMFNVAKPMQ
ncbi:MAG: VOC family protein [Asticcacaulis sp.]